MYFADLHCDLLCYLERKKNRIPQHEECPCSSSWLKKGNVRLQTLAVYTETGAKSVRSAEKQMEIFASLPSLYPEDFTHLKSFKIPEKEGPISIVAAIENASGICGEKENLETGLKRLDSFIEKGGPILYISLTWNQENRFGGGNLTKIGLKKDGETLLEYLDGKKIAIDLSHTSDRLAHDIFDHIEKKKLDITTLASHSNFRAVCDQPRNLPDDIAKEIAARGGVIGLNFVRAFIGNDLPNDFSRQIDYAKTLGVFDSLTLGADFFYEWDPPMTSSQFFPFFYPPFGNSGCYPHFFEYLGQKFEKNELDQLGYKNLEKFFKRMKV